MPKSRSARTPRMPPPEEPNSVQIIATSQITWTATSDQGWLTFASPPSGAGNGNVSYSVAGNPYATSRVATITVTSSSGSATLAVTQFGGALSISPASVNIGPAGDSGTIAVNTEDPLLQLIAVSSDTTWLSIPQSGSTGIGTGSVPWTGSPNTTNHTRTATITVTPLNGLGQTFTATQLASADPRITFSPSSANVDAAGEMDWFRFRRPTRR